MRNPITIIMLLALTGCAVQPVAPVGRETFVDSSVPNLLAQPRGVAYAQANCSGCHAIGATDESPLPAAPPFRTLGLRYPVDDLAEAFAEGMDTAHPAMPEFVMSTEENSDLIAYLKSIQAR